MHPELVDQLLFKDEGEGLDFKSEQYAFAKATDHQKAELLKDILAMANAWRDGPGYILIGFKENRPNRAVVVGIADHLDDAALQQFVTQKVTPKVQFRYEEFLYEGKHVGVIVIPKQKRAFWLAKDFAFLRANIVYVRRGSSTDQASPAEVHSMMNADAGKGTPRIELAALDREFNAFSKPVERRFLRFEKNLPDFYTPSAGPFDIKPWPDNRDYWRELAKFFAIHYAAVKVQLEIANFSEFSLNEVQVEITKGSDSVKFDFLTTQDLPNPPSETTLNHLMRLPTTKFKSALQIENHGREERCVLTIGVLRPGQTMQPEDALIMRFHEAGRAVLVMRVFANELSTPVEVRTTIDTEGQQETLNFDGLEALFDQRMPRV